MGSATSRSVIMVTSAPAGSGKTYVRCARFIPVFFRDGGVKHISNFPIKREAMRAFLDRKGYLPGAEFDNRVVELTRGLLNDWEHERGGPWEYFREVDLTGFYLPNNLFNLDRVVSPTMPTGYFSLNGSINSDLYFSWNFLTATKVEFPK